MKILAPIVILALTLAITFNGMQGVSASMSLRVDSSGHNLNTLAGKLASLDATPGLALGFSEFVRQEADMSDWAANPSPNTAITPTFVLSSSLDASTVAAPDVTVNQDNAAATQNEPAIAVNPNNPNQIVAASNDYVTRTWTCSVGTTPCSALGDGYSGTYFSNDGGNTWCCVATDLSHIGTLIPGVQQLVGGQYDAGGDPALAFSTPQLIVSNVLYDQGSHIEVGPDGTVYVFWDGSTRLASFDSTWVTKSTDGGVTWTYPVAIAPLVDIHNPQNTAFRLNSYPYAAVAPNGNVYAVWSSEALNTATSYGVDATCFSSNTVCHAAVYWSESTDAGATWSTPQLAFPALDASSRTAIGYPQAQPSGGTLNAPAAQRVDGFFPTVGAAPNGNVYVSSYAADVVSPWQRCAQPANPTAVGRINCLALDNYINNARLDYVVTDLTTGSTQTVTTHPINTRYQFGGGFIGDYTGIAVGSDNAFHVVWTDTNNVQTVVWWYGFQFVPTSVHQQDIVTATGSF